MEFDWLISLIFGLWRSCYTYRAIPARPERRFDGGPEIIAGLSIQNMTRQRLR
jgi:hypothetical protein